ncbi:cathepsin K-like [Bombyx mandarina]|uniref:Cathepsin K-like n=1 Tax=Bombyx mandarina TaxID=7092 RepID=A0A6J2KHU5_BOMMA|nr:cathepsin K-like [Bombyx mandarina]
MSSYILTFCVLFIVNFTWCFRLENKDRDTREHKIKWPTEFYLKGEEIKMKDSTLEKPFEMWYSASLKRSRVDHGAEKRYYYAPTDENDGTMYLIHPVTIDHDLTTGLSCSEDVYDKRGALLLPRLGKLQHVGNKTIDDHVVEILRSSKTIKDMKMNIEALVYWQDGYHIPVRITIQQYTNSRGSLDSVTISNYYNFKSKVDPSDLDVENEEADCSNATAIEGRSNYWDLNYNRTRDLAFKRFQNYHNVLYDVGEYEMRKAIFQDNLDKIIEHNKKNLSYKMEINQFADKTEEELKYLSGTWMSRDDHVPLPFPYTEAEIDEMVQALPDDFDLRLEGVISPVKNQDNCGSCWAFCSAASIGGSLARRNGGRDLALSEQSLIDCAWAYNLMGCDGGAVDDAMQYVMQHGIPVESEYGPYMAINGYCNLKNMSKLYIITGYGQVTPRSPNALKLALYKYGPVAAGVHVTSNMKFYSNGIFYDVDCDNKLQNHCVTVVGYGVRDGDTYWIVKNSWGEGWGEGGYILLSATNNNCLLNDIAYYSVI